MTEPRRRERLRPAELIGFAGIIALFAGGVIFMVTRGPFGFFGFCLGATVNPRERALQVTCYLCRGICFSFTASDAPFSSGCRAPCSTSAPAAASSPRASV